MSNSDTLMQIQADLSGIPVLRMAETARASLRGAAFLAGSGGLLWDSLHAACQTVQVARRFMPSIDGECRRQQRTLWESRIAQELATAATPSHNQE